MPCAEIITIGTEILLGEIVNTNAYTLARRLRSIGVDVYRQTTVGDNLQRIAQAIRHAAEECEIVLTSGGLGPTVDDPTRQAVALALNLELEYRPDLWEQIQERFHRYGRQPTENNRRQAYVPKGALVLENPVGTAPAFIVETEPTTVISLPGVPREMEYLLEQAVIPYLRQRFSLQSTIKIRLLHTVGVGESFIDERIGDLEQLSNPTVGLAAHSGQVDVRITAKATSESLAEEMIIPVERELRQRLGAVIYGADEETLEEVALRNLASHGWTMVALEHNLNGLLLGRLGRAVQIASPPLRHTFRYGVLAPQLNHPQELLECLARLHREQGTEVALGVGIFPGEERPAIYLAIITPQGQQLTPRPFGGPPEYAPRWATHHALDLLRQLSPANSPLEK